MKKLVVVFLCFLASNAFASSADSGKCPWKIPFLINIHAVGIEDQFTEDNGGIEGNSMWDTTNDFFLNVDTITSFSFDGNPDDLEFSQITSPNYPFESPTTLVLSIEFDSGTNFINSITITQSNGYSHAGFVGTYNYYFAISSLYFDDSTIFSTDSSYSSHRINITESSVTSQSEYGSSFTQDFTASSVTLSGIFRPSTFSDPPAIVTEAPQPNNLAIYASNGSIACSFDVADHARDLELYSPLGIREANVTIPPNETAASLPHLPSGFYFVRLDGAVAKIFVAE
jgi:hypothetical protein